MSHGGCAEIAGDFAVKIAVFCERFNNVSFELIGKAVDLGDEVIALIEDGDAVAYHAYGANRVCSMELCDDVCAQGTHICEALQRIKPDAALFPATVRGRFLSAWAAARLGTGLTADCTDLRLTEEGLLEQVRPAYGGNLIAHILCGKERPQMASVRPGAFPLKPKSEFNGENTVASFHPTPTRALLHKLDFVPIGRGASLQAAEVIVAGGKGVGGKKGFDKLFELAELLGGAVGATRSAVDAGWISYDHQIGQTGVIVRPKLYIGVGISGLIQHIVGITSAQTIVAINKDRNAPIFRYANYGVVEDWEITIDSLIEHYRERKTEK